jgi:cyclic pyranopterin phosphate synthase
VVPSAVSGEDHGVASFTHLDGSGRARMVDVMGKPKTHRVAVARAAVVLRTDLNQLLSRTQGLAEIIETARYTGILAAKQTAKLIPLCHPIMVDSVTVEVRPSSHRFEVEAIAQIVERTGVEMEALTACAMAALSLVRAFQGADPFVSVEELTLWHKSGGRSGVWNHSDEDAGATSVVSSASTSESLELGRHL